MIRFSARFLIVALAATVLLAGMSAHPAQADGPDPAAERPFALPFAQPPGPDTWLLAQPYGSTTGAYARRFTTYGASGGIHFGVDLTAPCGTELTAIADGVVFAVDGPFGSPPHNLMIDHPQLGYASMYGHLLEAPDLKPGTRVKQGDVVALVGDSAELCYRRPHVHLEIRDLNHIRKFNPHLLIDANWDSLALTGSSGRAFARNLENPRQWQTLYDQPQVRTGGPIVNDFAETWPFDWSKRQGVPASPASRLAATQAATTTQPLTVTPVARQVTGGNCCTRPYWSRDSTQVRFIDQPSAAEPLGVWGVTVAADPPQPELVTGRLAVYSADRTLAAYPDRTQGLAVIERLSDGQQWEIDSGEHPVYFSPDSRRILWEDYNEDAPRDTRLETLWLADVDGSNVRQLFSGRRTGPVAWLPNDGLLMARGFAGTSDLELFRLSLVDGTQRRMLRLPRFRGVDLSPDRRHMVYYVYREADPARNGVWLLDLESRVPKPQKLPFFGTYRWRDNERLVYVPFDPAATEHTFFEYNITTQQTRPLFPQGTGLTIANNDWQVSPDGSQIALVAAAGTALDGIWILELD